MSTLYVVATPIGNLGDLSRRAVETLTSVARVLAEDTRRTRGLLSHLGITGKALQRLDAHATPVEIQEVAERIARGESAALVTDAGVPGVSDPGALLIRQAVAAGVSIVPIPGPSAVTTAVSICEFVQGPFLFLGFLPRQGKARKEALQRIKSAEEPVVLFESAERMGKTLLELAALAPERRALVCRELTKLHEQALRGTLSELSQSEREWLGEITFVVDAASAEEQAVPPPAPELLDEEIRQRLSQGERTRSIADDLSLRLQRPRREVYENVERIKREP